MISVPGSAKRAELKTAERPFDFDRDTFAFANELVWEYGLDAQAGTPVITRRQPPPTYAHRCFVLVRSARQFLYHARFDPRLPSLPPPAYRPLIRAVISRSPRRASAPENRVLIPGYDGLRSFSRAHEGRLKAECGGAWQSYVLRSHWRMVFPISRRSQSAMAGQLLRTLEQGGAPIIHVVRFPQLTINHGLLLFAAAPNETGLHFAVYDPNQPARPSKLAYDPAQRTFFFPRNHYWSGGRVDVIEIYRGWLF